MKQIQVLWQKHFLSKKKKKHFGHSDNEYSDEEKCFECKIETKSKSKTDIVYHLS